MIKLIYIIVSVFLLLGLKVEAQTNLEFDTLNYNVTRAKRKIPKESISFIGIESKREIAGRFGIFSKTCTGIGKFKKLNWLATDKKGHYIFSISSGGRAYNTAVYYFDTNNSRCRKKYISIENTNLNIANVLHVFDNLPDLRHPRSLTYP